MSHTLRRTLLALAAVAATGLLAALPAQARSLDDIRKDGKIVVATEGAFAPFNFFEGKKLSGYEVELAEAVVKQMGLKLEWKTIGFDALLAGLQQDKWDLVIASHGINEERAKAVTFAEPHYCTGGVIVSKEGKLKTAADLAGKVVAVQVGTSYMDNVKKVAGVKEVKTFPKDPEVMAALAAGRVDAAVSDKFTVREALGSKALTKANLKIGDFLFVEQVAAAVAKGNTGLAGAFNTALKALQGDGTVAKISQKYFKEDVTCK
jgi:polar amino acid transport system substrate-binding protein